MTVFGDTHTQQVSRVVWTAKGGKIGPGQFQSFPMSMLVPKAKAGTAAHLQSAADLLQRRDRPLDRRTERGQAGAAGADHRRELARAGLPGRRTGAKTKISKGIIFGFPSRSSALLGSALVRRRKA